MNTKMGVIFVRNAEKSVTMLSFREKVLKFWSMLTADGLVLLMISLPRPVVDQPSMIEAAPELLN